MPGLCHLGPTLTSTHGSQPLFQQDAYMPVAPDLNWDLVDLSHVQLPVVDEIPLVPKKHKACCPPKLHSAWMRGKGQGPSSGPSRTRARLTTSLFPIQCNGNSNDTEDLAAMVHDFIESGSSEFFDGNDSNGGPSGIAKRCETLQILTSSYGGIEGEIHHVVRSVVLALNVDVDLMCSTGGNLCKEECTKHLLVHNLRAAGYDAAVCKSKWESSSRVLGDEIHAEGYEYIDVEIRDGGHERYIIDVNFQDQFVLARATPHYLTALNLLPTVFVGTTKRLEQILEVMSEATKLSLEQNSMPLPPWRTLAFMNSKWLSPHERTTDSRLLSNSLKDTCSRRRNNARQSSTPETKKCGGVQFRQTNIESLVHEVVRGSTLNALGQERPDRAPRVKRFSNL